MKLEDELDISIPFENDHQKVMVNLVYTYNFFLEKTLQALRPFDINDQHYNVLKTLDYHYPSPISVGEIKRSLFNKRGDLTRLLDKLYSMGLVIREIDSDNRRVVLVTISPKGREQLREMDANLATTRDNSSTLSKEDIQQLNDLLDKLRG
jgi:DNA-binding MarR family transcriptional regulator